RRGIFPRRAGRILLRISRTGIQSLVEQLSDLLVIDIVLVVPVEVGWDLLFEFLAVDRVDGRLYGLRSDIEGALRDCAEHRPVADGIKLSLSGVEADNFDVIITELLDSLDDADGRTLVHAVDGIDVL